MKKNLLLLAAALLLIGGNLAAQEPDVLFTDSFEEYTAGNFVASESNSAGHTWWTTWSNAPGSAEDALVADNYASDGNKSAHLTYGDDLVLLLNDEQNGIYDIEFDILVPQGKNGYFNILHNFAGGNSTWAMQCYLHQTNDGQNSTSAPGHGTIHAGGNAVADVPCVYDGWMHFRLHVDTDHNLAQYYYTLPDEEEQMACEWQWDLDSFGENTVGRKLAAIDFYPPQNAATSEYYLDNISYTKTSGDTAPVVAFSVESIEKHFDAANDMDVIDFTISNEGSSIADYMGYIDFGEGTTSSATQDLGYFDENGELSVVSFNVDSLETSIIVEAGAMYPASYYGGAIMGTKVTKAKFYIGAGQDSGEDIPFVANTPLTFRIYGPALYNQPGELLAEKELPYSQLSLGWNEVTFDTPVVIRGFNFWVTAEFQQKDGYYPLTFDGATPNQNGAYYRTKGGGNFSNNANTDDPYGNVLIGVTCQGNPVLATWASLETTEGSLLIDQTDVMLLSLNSVGLADGTYTADMIFETNDPDNAEVVIPITVTVGGQGVIESVKSEVNVYPNPANGNFNITGINLSHATVYNAVGQMVEDITLRNGVNNINLNVESGVYFISIFDNEGNNSVQRLVINK
jgi:hypothetical protein